MASATVPADQFTNSRIVAAYRQRTPGSADLARQAAELLPSGIAHDSRHVEPHNIYVARALGPHKWDVDGNRYVDYYGGHGALILGHSHPDVLAATVAAAAEGSQFGANHVREIGWVRAIQRLIPAAERVRFTSSGTEATLMAVRLARAFTGRPKLMRIAGHFHGWNDHMASGYSNHFDGTPAPGVLQGITDATVLIPPNDFPAAEAAFAAHPDIAGIILEPTGASFGQVPVTLAFLHGLRWLTQEYGALLIFDEVITGFRTSRGGAQQALGIRPDLSCFAKIVAGGLPGAAVAGRRDIMDMLDFQASAALGREKVSHAGTFNANPISAAAGIAALTILAEGDANELAAAAAAALRDGMNEVLAQEGVAWAAYGTSSGFHVFLNPEGRALVPAQFDPLTVAPEELKKQSAPLVNRIRVAMLANGVDLGPRLGGFTSATHAASDIADTLAAWRETIHMLRAENELPEQAGR
jgi:glutamate-1-semialdehyde 2,1-aminomutase